MRRSIWLVSSLLFFSQDEARPPHPELDLGQGTEILTALPVEVAREAIQRVAEHVGRPVAELEDARLYAGSIRINGGPEQACELVWMPLAGPARGGHLVSAVHAGTPLAVAIEGALDLDEDPTGRWHVFVMQVLAPWGGPRTITLEVEPAQEVERRLAGIRTDEGARLARALLAQRMAMRNNASLGLLVDRGRLPRAEWLRDLAAEMARVAELAPDLAPLIGAEDARSHAERASELSNVYADFQSLLEGEPDADAATLAPDLRELDQRRNASCRACHESDRSAGSLRERFVQRRTELDLHRTLLWPGYDVAPALGDDGKASAEIVDKLRASVLLAEAVRGPSSAPAK